MNITLTEYRKKLKTDNIFILLGVLALILVQVLAFCQVITPAVPGPRFASYWNGFIAGASLGVTALLLAGLIRNLLALRDEDRLRRCHAKDYDERARHIQEKGQAAGLRVCLLLLLPACVITGYFNVTVFCTCVAVAFLQGVIVTLAKLYYRRKL